MATIALEQIKNAFTLAAQVFDHALEPEVAANRLHEAHGLNISSARDFLMQFRCMMQGKVFKRTLSATALEYFLPQILLERGHDAAAKAVAAVRDHIDYYEGIEKTKLPKLRSIVAEFEKSLAELPATKTYSNSYCQAWIRGQWNVVPVQVARLRPALVKRCLECYGPIVLMAAGRNNSTRAHAEHRPGHRGCSLGLLLRRNQDRPVS